eukprot:jgi/Galph1/2587/GphlegSOOS_G1259.1
MHATWRRLIIWSSRFACSTINNRLFVANHLSKTCTIYKYTSLEQPSSLQTSNFSRNQFSWWWSFRSQQGVLFDNIFSRLFFSTYAKSNTNEAVKNLSQVLLVNEEGQRIGVMTGTEAYNYAVESESDLMEVAGKAKPPVWKLVDLKEVLRAIRLKEKADKKQALEQRRKFELKEIRVSPGIDDHDFGIKMERAREFLTSGRRVRFSFRFRKGQGKYASRLESLAKRITEEMKDISSSTVVKRRPRLPPQESLKQGQKSEEETEQNPFEIYIEPKQK